jgi:hypothetical protein
VTKAERIRKLHKTGKYATTAEIADAVGCLPEYVRVVVRQRKDGISEADRRYQASPLGKAARERHESNRAARVRRRYASDPEFRRMRIEHNRRWYWERGGREWARRRYDASRRAEAGAP